MPPFLFKEYAENMPLLCIQGRCRLLDIIEYPCLLLQSSEEQGNKSNIQPQMTGQWKLYITSTAYTHTQ